MSNNADYIEEKIEMKNITPFKMFTLTKFPFIEETFDALNNYQLLCKIVEYLNKVIDSENNQNENINQLYSAFLALQLHVNTYFDMLDVQDEINNKLDEMTENGLLEDIIGKYIDNSMLRIFENVESFKKNENLFDGMKIKTLGYYEKNDGGNGLYYIRKKTNDDVEDNGLIHFLNNELVAELIIENGVNVKQFGSKGNGENDDTLSIQKAIDSLRSKILSSDIANINMIFFPAGKYKITQTITVSPFVKLKSIGYTAILSYVENGTCLHFTSQTDDFNNSIGNKQDWFRGSWLNGESGLIIKNMINNDNLKIGIEVGTKTNLGTAKNAARFNMNDVRIQGFNIGLLYNINNVYIATLNRFNFESNSIGVQYGNTAGLVVNSGEKMSYDDCIFAGNDISVNWLCDGMHSYFINTSFDFNKCCFYDKDNKGYHDIVLSHCHIEGNGSLDISIPRGIIYGKMQFSQIRIVNSCIFTTGNSKMFTVGTNESPDYYLSLENNKMLFSADNHDFNLEFLADDKIIPTSYYSNIHAHGSKGRLFNNNLSLVNDFNLLELGIVNYTETQKIGEYTIPYSNNISLANGGISIIEDSIINKKVLNCISANESAVHAIHLQSDFIPVYQNKLYIAKSLTKGYSNPLIKMTYYDNNKNEIGASDSYIYNNDVNQNEWYIQSAIKRIRTPKKCCYIRVTLMCQSNLNVNDFRIGGLFLQIE